MSYIFTRSKKILNAAFSPDNLRGSSWVINFYALLFCVFINAIVNAQSCIPATAFDYLDINNVKSRINNGGDMWWDLIGEAKYIVPKTGNVSSLFAGALWIGGLDAQGNLHMAAQTYRQNGNDFFPGPLDASGSVSQTTCDNFDRMWKVNKTTIDSFTAGLFAVTPASISQWPGRHNPNLSFLPDQELAPFVDVNGDELYNSDDGDYPAFPGDQALWFVFNDAGNTHYETGGTPLGIEVQCLVYGFKDPAACTYSTTFYHYKILNKSGNNYDSVYMGLWTDPDLGCYTDDYAGCDSANNLGVIYNSGSADASTCTANYGNQPPVLAIQLLKGPADENGVIHYMDHCMLYVNDFSAFGNPENATQYYQYLKSVFKQGDHLVNPITGLSTNYACPSDPTDINGWSMCAENSLPSDFRIIVSSGPVILKAGTKQTLDFAAVWDNTSVYPCPSYSTIIDVAGCVKQAFDDDIVFTGSGNIISANNHCDVFPNPVAGSAMINFSGKNFSRVEIFDLAGKKLFVAEAKENDVLKVNSDQLGKGLFIYRITFSDHSITSGKIVVQ